MLHDASGRAVPWHSTVADFDFDDNGLENLVDLDGDGRAELLVPQVDGFHRVHARPGDRSIEAITRYVISTNGLKRQDGAVAQWVFPILSPPDAKGVNVEDWSTYVERASVGVTIKSVLPKCPKPMIRLGDPSSYECRISLSDGTTLLGRPEIIVLDDSSGRQIEFASVESVDQLIEKAWAGAYDVEFTCKTKEPMCRPFLMWAREKPR